MDEMLGKDYVVKEMNYGGVGLASPDGSQGGVWFFPKASVRLWKDTKAGQAPPVARLAYRAARMPDQAKMEIQPPGRDDAPWDYKIQGTKLMKPVAPQLQEHVDFEKSALRLPPWKKVRQILSVECMEKTHKDPKYICKPEDYASYVPPAPTTTLPLSPAEAEKLRKRVRHLESTIRSLTQPRKYDNSAKHPAMKITSDNSMNKAVTRQERVTDVKPDKATDRTQELSVKKFRDSESTLPKAQSHAERPCKSKPTGPGDGT